MRRWGLGTTGGSSSSRDTFVWRSEWTNILSREEDELRELLELFESALLILSLAFLVMVPENVSTHNTRRIWKLRERLVILAGRYTTTNVRRSAFHEFIQGETFWCFQV